MTLLTVRPDPEPLQSEVLKPLKGNRSREDLLEKFCHDLFKRVSEAPEGNLLSLDYFLSNVNLKLKADDLNQKYPTWTNKMGEDYKEFFRAVDGYVTVQAVITKAGKVRAHWHTTFFSSLQVRERQGPNLSVSKVVLWIIFLMNSVKTFGNP